MKGVLLCILGIFVIYVVARLVTKAYFKSKEEYDIIKQQNGGNNNGEE